jgi:formate-dependent nitrite reductase cytochrome c552 subunit
VAAGSLLLAGGVSGASAAEGAAGGAVAVPAAPGYIKPVQEETCYGCHVQIKEMHATNKHASVNCAVCHTGTDEHLAKGPMAKPVTKLDHATCGTCHADQYGSFKEFNPKSGARIEKAQFRSRSPLFDKLIAGHGFAFEHNEPRQHAFMLIDHFIVDRAYGGRFQLKDWTHVSDVDGALRDPWSILTDAEPATDDQKKFKPYVATAANPVCLNCKTADHILKWKYMGDKDPRAQWDRSSKTVAFARDLKHPLNCFMCHDPHSTQPRVVRDGLIQQVVDQGRGTYPYDKGKSEKNKMTKVMFRDFRAIGLLSRPDSNTMCAQCHVEYNCNPGYDIKQGYPKSPDYTVKMDSQLTNYFPWVNVLDYYEHMTKVAGFRDFKHAVTGAMITKMQHPEAETNWGSKHERAGVECKDCHMPKVTSGPHGKTYTWHGQKSAKYMLHDTCVRCHEGWTGEEAAYQIEAIQNFINGKIIKAEFWIGQFIDAFKRARDAGVSEEVLMEAREFHSKAHPLWEWWTAENSVGFHNPEIARESLAKAITTAQDGIKFLNEAVDKVKAEKKAEAAPVGDERKS